MKKTTLTLRTIFIAIFSFLIFIACQDQNDVLPSEQPQSEVSQSASQATVAATKATVWWKASIYYATVDGVVYKAADFADALRKAVGLGNRDVEVTCGGYLSGEVQIRANTRIWIKNNNQTITTGSGYRNFYAYKSDNLLIDGLRLKGKGSYAIYFSACNNTRITNIKLDNGAIRVDSKLSNPWEAKVSGLHLENITVDNFTGMDGQGVETYSVDNYFMKNIRGNNLRGCAVCINNSNNGRVEGVWGYRCCRNGGYAALRFVSDCVGAKVTYVWARECGRGFVSGRCHKIDVDKVDIEGSTSDAILITGGSTKVRILGGTYKGKAINHYTNPPNNGNVINAKKLD